MKKKILSVIIALFLVVSSVFALTACKNNETNNNQEEVVIGDNTNNNSNNSGNGSNSNSDSGNGSNSNNDSGNGQSDEDDSNQELEDNGSGNGSNSGSGNGSGTGTGDDSGNGSNNDQVNAQALAMVSEKVVALLANSTVRASVDKSLGLRGEKAESDDTEEYELLLADGSAYMNIGDDLMPMFLSQEFAVTEEDATQALAVVLGFAQEYNLLAVDAQVTSNGYEVVVTLDLAETLNNVIDFLYENLDTSIYDLLAPTGLVESLNLGLVDLFDGLTSETTIEDLVNMVGQALGYDGVAEIVAENFDDIKAHLMEADVVPMDISSLDWDTLKSFDLGTLVALAHMANGTEYDTTPAFNVQLADLVTGSLVAVLSDTTLGEALELAESTILEIAELTRDELYYTIYGPSGAGYMDLSASSLIPNWEGNPPTPDQPVVFTLLERTNIAEASVSFKFTFDLTANLVAVDLTAKFNAVSEAGEQNIGLIDAEFNTELTFENVGDTEAPDAEEVPVATIEEYLQQLIALLNMPEDEMFNYDNVE